MYLFVVTLFISSFASTGKQKKQIINSVNIELGSKIKVNHKFSQTSAKRLFASHKMKKNRKRRVIRGSYKKRSKNVRMMRSRSKKIKVKHLKNRRPKQKIKLRTVQKKKIKSKRKKRRVRKKSRRRRRRKTKVYYPKMPIYQIHTRDYMRIQVYDKRGKIRKRALQRFNKISYCYRSGKKLRMNALLLVELYHAWLYFGMPQITLFSGCRQPPYASATSRHVSGNAIDFNFDGINRKELIKYFLKKTKKLRSYHLGVGFYPNSYHIHLDIRKKDGFWVDLGGPGEGGSYVSNPYSYFYKKIYYARNKKKKLTLSRR